MVAKPGVLSLYQVPGQDLKRPLTAKEYTEYVQRSGAQIYDEINSKLNDLSNLNQDDLKKAIDKIVRDDRKSVRDEILSR